MRLSLVPPTREFYGLFADAGDNALAAATLVEQRFREHPDSTVSQEQVKAVEHEGDRLTAELFRLLNTHYVTPFDREDIYGLASAVDTVVDYIESASELLDLYKIEAPMEQASAQCGVLVGAAEHLAHALAQLRGLRGIQAHLVEIKRFEDEGDRIVRDAIAALFEDEEISPRAIIRWKDIFEALEQAIDACDTAAHVVGNIVLKNA